MVIAGVAVLVGLGILVFPPWTARAVRTTTRYALVAGVAPATVVDTLKWRLRFSPIYAPPRAVLTAPAMRDLAERAQTGDTAARSRLTRLLDPFERRVRAPEILRTAGELWRDSVLAAAGMPSVSWYQVGFALDDTGIVLRLAAVALVAVILDRRRLGVRAALAKRARRHTRPRQPAESGN
jgi:hypothetical protein